MINDFNYSLKELFNRGEGLRSLELSGRRPSILSMLYYVPNKIIVIGIKNVTLILRRVLTPNERNTTNYRICSNTRSISVTTQDIPDVYFYIIIPKSVIIL